MTHDTPTSTTSRRGLLRGMAAGAIAAVTGAAAGSTPAAARHRDGVFQGGEFDASDTSYRAFLGGFRQRLWGDLAGVRSDTTAAELRDDLLSSIDGTEVDVVAWANDRDFEPHVTTMAVEFQQDDTSAELTLDAQYDDGAGEWTSFEATSGASNPGERAVLSGFAARNADEEYDRFYAEFVEPREPITGDYASEMAGKYGESDHVASTLLGDSL